VEDDLDLNPDFLPCANCGGDFYYGDMDGEHCRECADELFGGDDV